MGAKISTKKVWVSDNAWRGHYKPINAVAGCNDTGTFSDSPCNSNVRKQEVSAFTKKLRANNIEYKTMWCQTSNIFCVTQFVLVAEENKAKAIELAEAHQEETTLFYAVK